VDLPLAGEQRACPHPRLQTFAFLSGMPGKRILSRKTALSANPFDLAIISQIG
jgi:hypothetical protein